MTASAEASVKSDFINYCPGVDDELEDDVIVFRVWEKEEEATKDEEVTEKDS